MAQALTEIKYKSGNEKRSLKQDENEMLKKHTKLKAFLKSDTGEANKEQEPVEERIEEEVWASVEKDRILEEG